MKRFNLFLVASLIIPASFAVAEDKKETAVVGHCEKMNKDGTEEDIDAKDKADCKAKGGKWNKKAKDDHGGKDHK